MAARASVTASISPASAGAGSSPFCIAASRRTAASATANAPIARADPFSVCASAPASGGKVASAADQADGLGREHRQHLALEAGIAERHAPEMFEIDRTVIGSKRRRWHPVNLFQTKRHGDSPISRRDRSGNDVVASQPWKWLTERSAHLPQVRLVFGEESPHSAGRNENFVGP